MTSSSGRSNATAARAIAAAVLRPDGSAEDVGGRQLRKLLADQLHVAPVDDDDDVGRAAQQRGAIRSNVSRSRVRSPSSRRNGFGRSGRESGQSRVPPPPARITAYIGRLYERGPGGRDTCCARRSAFRPRPAPASASRRRRREGLPCPSAPRGGRGPGARSDRRRRSGGRSARRRSSASMIAPAGGRSWRRSRPGCVRRGRCPVPNVSIETESGPGDADPVGHLDLEAVGQAGRDHVLGHPARRVGGRAVDLRRVLARERAATVAGHARRRCRR